MEKPYAGRSQIKEGFNEIEVIIPSLKSVKSIVFVNGAIILQSLCCIFLYIICSLRPSPADPIFFLVEVLVSILAFILWLRVILWAIAGAEIIRVNQNELSIEWKGSLFPYKAVYDIKEVKNIRMQEMNPYFNPNDLARSFMGRPNGYRIVLERPRKLTGNIFFDYGMKSVIFGMSIDIPEARYISAKLNNFIQLSQRTAIRY